MTTGDPRLYSYLWKLQSRLERLPLHRRAPWLSGLLYRLRNQLFPRDFLTGAYRRVAFIKRVRAALAAGETGALLSIDLDHFAWVNYTWGHVDGDECLQRFVSCLRDVTAHMPVGRFGGDEFLVYTERGAAAEELAEQIRLRIEQDVKFTGMRERVPRRINSESIANGHTGSFLTASIGVAWAKPGSTFEELFQAADEALNEAKVGGRNRVAVRRSGS